MVLEVVLRVLGEHLLDHLDLARRQSLVDQRVVALDRDRVGRADDQHGDAEAEERIEHRDAEDLDQDQAAEDGRRGDDVGRVGARRRPRAPASRTGGPCSCRWRETTVFATAEISMTAAPSIGASSFAPVEQLANRLVDDQPGAMR